MDVHEFMCIIYMSESIIVPTVSEQQTCISQDLPLSISPCKTKHRKHLIVVYKWHPVTFHLFEGFCVNGGLQPVYTGSFSAVFFFCPLHVSYRTVRHFNLNTLAP